MTPTEPTRPRVRWRPRIFYVVLVALLLISILPIWVYHRLVLSLSQDKLSDTERLQQTEVTRSLAEEIHLYRSSLYQQLAGQRQIFALAGLIGNIDDKKNEGQVTTLLENLVNSNPNILYATAVGQTVKGWGAGDARVAKDDFVKNLMKRAFFTAQQRAEFHSDPLAFGADSRPAFIMALPLTAGEEFKGMLAVVVSLDRILERLNEASVRGREVYVVDRSGRIVAHPNTRRYVPGQDVSASVPLVARLKSLEEKRRATETAPFVLTENGKSVEMIGTYSTLPQLNWAVMAQRSLDDARKDAGVEELNRQAIGVAAVVAVLALFIGYWFAFGISRPIRGLAESTQAISRGDFQQRVNVRGAAEISELAETFNKMAGDIEEFIAQLKQAAEENRELFIGSIRMLSAAIDEKDPYTRGHSGRVAKYSVIIGEQLNLNAMDIDQLRISALLHDVGKIGIDDRVLKKPGTLTPEEFEIMKQHPAKGANIMRPVAQLREMLPGIELHHEHMDGRGYPYGLKGDQVPMMARIIAVADTLDAMTTNRPYQTAMELGYALERIRALGTTKFDPAVVTALDAVISCGKLKLSATLVEV
ncbi:MAG: HD domain-containing protein [Acidobacteria bacterium]|nr:HD domain-containing protein [Acidobacteriota bacterium]